MRTPFKMKGFSGFGNSPLKQDKKKTKEEMTDKEIQETIARQDEKWEITEKLDIDPRIIHDARKTATDSANVMNEELFRRGYSWDDKGKLVEPK